MRPRWAAWAARGTARRQLLWLIVAAAVACALLLTWIFGRARAIDPHSHFGYSSVLQALREADARVDAELLASRLELVRNYDRLNRGLADMQAASDQALTPPAFLAEPEREGLRLQAQALRATVDRKLRLVDRFRRDNAVARNSLAFFPLLAERMLDEGGRDGQLELARYVNGVLAYSRAPNDDRHLQVLQAKSVVSGARMSALRRESLAPLLQHGDLILEYTRRLDTLTHDALALNLASQLDDINRAYVASHARAEGRAERFRYLLLALSLTAASFLAFTFLRLDGARRALARAHKEITERLAAQQKAEAELRLHATAFRNAHEGITLTDAERRIVDVNPAFTRITGFERSEVIGRNPRVLKSGRHDDAYYQAMWRSLNDNGNWRGEIWNRNKYGEVYPELLSISAVHDDSGRLSNYVAIFSDISRLKEQERQLTQMAYYDPLTDLPNRTLLADRMGQAVAQARRSEHGLLAVCYLDLDGFKPINDRFGHEAGDRVLVEIAERLQGALRGGDTVSRLGGDEFVLLLINLNDLAHLHQVLQRMLVTISQPLKCLPQPASISGSIGVAVFPTDDSDVDTLLRHADQAMYQAKQRGEAGGYHLFDPALDRDVRTRQDGVKRIVDALRAHEFVLHYQPKVDMRRGTVFGAEALIRWRHPERGLLAPIEFLPLIDNHECIVEVGQWVIDTALQQMQAWRDQGLDLAVSVNVAGRQLQHPNFLADLRRSLERHPDAARRLELEVLETAALEDIGKVSHVIAECQAMGVDFALDDFGTGYSSLTYLKRLPARTIKIDQSFVREMLNDHNNLVIVQGVLGLAQAFGRAAIAEGVESVEHGRMLLQLECDLGQGFGIARPMPPEELPGWVAHWQCPDAWQQVRHRRWDEDLWPLLAAQVQHRNWIAKLIYAVREGQPVPRDNLTDHLQCGFGHWYHGAGAQSRYRGLEAFRALDEPHRKVHETAAEIDRHWRRGQHAEARALLESLIGQRDRVTGLLHALEMGIAQAR